MNTSATLGVVNQRHASYKSRIIAAFYVTLAGYSRLVMAL